MNVSDVFDLKSETCLLGLIFSSKLSSSHIRQPCLPPDINQHVHHVAMVTARSCDTITSASIRIPRLCHVLLIPGTILASKLQHLWALRAVALSRKLSTPSISELLGQGLARNPRLVQASDSLSSLEGLQLQPRRQVHVSTNLSHLKSVQISRCDKQLCFAFTLFNLMSSFSIDLLVDRTSCAA